MYRKSQNSTALFYAVRTVAFLKFESTKAPSSMIRSPKFQRLSRSDSFIFEVMHVVLLSENGRLS